MISEKVVFATNVLCPGAELFRCGHSNATLIVFEYTTDGEGFGGDLRCCSSHTLNKTAAPNFFNQTTHGNELSHAMAESHVFCFSCRKSNFSLELADPEDGAVAEAQNEACAREN